MIDSLLTLQEVSKSFDMKNQRNLILNQINLQINKAENIAITGPSGSGKSTLLHILSGIQKTDSGIASYKNIDYKNVKNNILEKIYKKDFGFIFQTDYLFNELNVLQNILLPVWQRQKEYKDDAIFMLKELNLIDKLKCKVSTLSNGEKQRISLIRSLIKKPTIIFADEPTSSLSQNDSKICISMLMRLKSPNCTIVMVTHDTSIIKNDFKHFTLNQGNLV
jgi:putative ABC transport system ATP-binding protein